MISLKFGLATIIRCGCQAGAANSRIGGRGGRDGAGGGDTAIEVLVGGSEVGGETATRKGSVVDGGDTEGVVEGVLETGIMSTGEGGGSAAVVVGGGGAGASGDRELGVADEGGDVGASDGDREAGTSDDGFTTG